MIDPNTGLITTYGTERELRDAEAARNRAFAEERALRETNEAAYLRRSTGGSGVVYSDANLSPAGKMLANLVCLGLLGLGLWVTVRWYMVQAAHGNRVAIAVFTGALIFIVAIAVVAAIVRAAYRFLVRTRLLPVIYLVGIGWFLYDLVLPHMLVRHHVTPAAMPSDQSAAAR